MQWVSILGLFAILAIAWSISYHRWSIRIRPIAWGLGLQLVMALIILRHDHWSFIGMAALGCLLVAFIFRPQLDENWHKTAISTVAAFASGGCLLFLPAEILGWVWLAALLCRVVIVRFVTIPRSRSLFDASLVVIGVAYLISSGTNGEIIFQALSTKIADFLNLSDYGARFLFGNLADPDYFGANDAGWRGFGFQFAFKVLPTIVFFGGFMGVLYYYGIVQKVILAIARFMRWTFGTSGAETLSCSANIFVGQTEAPLLVRPFIATMTRSELLTIMVGGFATIAGGVLAGYIAFGVPPGHLVAATVMSAPAALAISKIILPELEESKTSGDIDMPDLDVGDNAIEAASAGITDGLKLAVNVGAMLIGFIALVAVVDISLNALDRLIDGHWLGGDFVPYETQSSLSAVSGEHAGIFPGSLQRLFGVLLKPLAWLIGVPWEEADEVGNLLGVKLALNEFVSFGTLGTYIQGGELSQRAIVISTYALCGFANFSSIGIQLGGLSALAPERRSDLAKVGLRAMIGGALASWTTATVAGMLV